MKFALLLYGMLLALRFTAWKHPAFAKRVGLRNFTAQIRTFDGSVGRYFTFRGGKILSASGIHAAPDICISIASAALGARAKGSDSIS